MPDFLGIGAQKAGTTWLYRNLRAHPEIWMPKEKELHYFDEKISLQGGLSDRLRGNHAADWRWRRQARSRIKHFRKNLSFDGLAWDLKYFFGRADDAWYASLFENGRGKVVGETTPDYSILDRDTIAHVHEIMPDARIIFMMRNPIERPWSVIEMVLRINGKTLDETSEKQILRHLENRRSRAMTDYLRTLENWSAFFPAERIFVGFLEDVSFFPEELLRAVYGFLGVDPSVKYRVIKRKIHSGHQSTMPTRFAVHLARSYHDDIERLGERFGGYASFWLYCAERLIEDPPEETEIPYPLWESAMWEEWEGSRNNVFRSGPLSEVQTTR